MLAVKVGEGTSSVSGGDIVFLTNSRCIYDAFLSQLSLDRYSYWIKKYVLVSYFCGDRADMYRLFRYSEHFQFLDQLESLIPLPTI